MSKTTTRMYQTCRKQRKTYQFVGNHILKTKVLVVSSTSKRALSLKKLQNDTTNDHAMSQYTGTANLHI